MLADFLPFPHDKGHDLFSKNANRQSFLQALFAPAYLPAHLIKREMAKRSASASPRILDLCHVNLQPIASGIA
nr:hypothetical protein BCU62_07980 [Enterovibrio norvegicus]